MNLLPQYDTKLFTDIYEKVEDFVADYQHVGIPTTISVNNATTLYYLLYSKYGNTPIANFDENQFKYKLFSVVFMYGPAWEKKLDIQATLRGLTEDQIKTGMARAISNTGTIGNTGSNTYNNLTSADSGSDVHNHAYNPATDPTTQTTTELNYINEQHVDKFGKTNTMTGSVSNTNTQTNNLATSDAITKGILDSYEQLWSLISSDVTAEFLNKFNICFKKFVKPANPLIYVTDDEE